MKNYRKLVPIVLLLFLGLSWYKMYSDIAKVDDKYQEYLQIARDYADKKVTKMAVQYYSLALEVKSTPEIYAEVADYYKSTENMSDYIKWCEDFLNVYPTSVLAYEHMLDAYILAEDYKNSFKVIEVAQKRKLSSEKIDELSQSIWNKYTVETSHYQDVGAFGGGYCPVKKDDKWGYVSTTGKVVIACKYDKAGAFVNGIASVVTSQGKAFFIDEDGDEIKVAPVDYQEYGIYYGGYIAAQKSNGKYTFLDSKLVEENGEYDFATSFNGGVAAVKNGDSWSLVDENLARITGEEYSDVIMDKKGLICRSNRIFVQKSNGKYVMLDEKGAQVGNTEFDDAKPFLSQESAAVKVNGKWCFVDLNGNLSFENTYEETNSFSNGYAAVCVDGKWGFIDTDGNVVIEFQFDGATDMNEKGSSFVMNENSWFMLRLYRLNK